MADNLSNIEDALKKIKDSSGSIQEKLDDNFDVKLGTLNNSIVNLATAISKMDGSSSTGKQKTIPAKVNWTKFDQGLSKFGNDLEKYGKQISEPVEKLNSSIVEANLYLKAIAAHITNQSSAGAPAQQGSQNAGNVGSGKGVDGIHSTVKEILGVLREIQNGQRFTGKGSKSVNDAIMDAAKLHAENKKTEENYIKALQKDKKDRSQEEKDAIEAKRRERKNRKKEEGGPENGTLIKALHGVESIGKTVLTTDKASFSKTADATIGALKSVIPGMAGGIIGGILEAVKTAFDIGAKEQRSASDFSRQFGGSRIGMLNAQRTARGLIQSDRAKELGYTIDQAYSAMTEVSESLGRTAEKMNQRDLESAVNLKRFGVGGQAISNFDTFGKSLQETDHFFTKLYSDVSKKGLSFKNVSKAVNDNLKMAQSHTFANGLRGLAAMAEKAVQLKYNMQQVAAFSDKVSTVEGAITASANLSVLGGSFAQYGDPMQLLYESLNDQEALNNRMIDMFGKNVAWDSTKGEFTMSPEDRLRMKAAAQAAGLNPDEMMNLAYNNARVEKVGAQIGRGVGGDTAEYIKNIAALDKNGQAYVTLNGQRKNVSDLNEGDKELLKKESEKKGLTENADLGSIYGETMSIGEKLDNILNFLQQKLYMAIYRGLDFLSGGYLGGMDKLEKKAKAAGFNEEQIAKMQSSYFEIADDDERLKEEVGRGGRRGRNRLIDRLVTQGYANGYSPDEADILSNVPGNGVIGGAYHADGGTPIMAEKDEFIMNRISSGVYKNELAAMQRLAYNPVNAGYMRNADTVSVMGLSKPSGRGGGEVSGTIKVDIPQTITINLAGGGMIGQYDISNIIKKYVDSFMKEAQIRSSFGGFDKENFYNQSTVI